MNQPVRELESGNPVDPVCGMEVNPESPHRYTYNHIEYGFCSRSCLDKFRTRPERFLKPVQDTDPVCGTAVTEESEYQFHYDGFKYHFCSDHCRKKFAADPSHYLSGEGFEQATAHGHDQSDQNIRWVLRCMVCRLFEGRRKTPSNNLNIIRGGCLLYFDQETQGDGISVSGLFQRYQILSTTVSA